MSAGELQQAKGVGPGLDARTELAVLLRAKASESVLERGLG